MFTGNIDLFDRYSIQYDSKCRHANSLARGVNTEVLIEYSQHKQEKLFNSVSIRI